MKICSTATSCSRSRWTRSTVWLSGTLRSSSPWINSTVDFHLSIEQFGEYSHPTFTPSPAPQRLPHSPPPTARGGPPPLLSTPPVPPPPPTHPYIRPPPATRCGVACGNHARTSRPACNSPKAPRIPGSPDTDSPHTHCGSNPYSESPAAFAVTGLRA